MQFKRLAFLFAVVAIACLLKLNAPLVAIVTGVMMLVVRGRSEVLSSLMSLASSLDACYSDHE